MLWTQGSGLFLTYTALFSFVAESGHRHLRGAAFGLIFAFQLLGGAAGLFLAGFLADAFGTTPGLQTSIPLVLAGVCALVAFVFLLGARSRVVNGAKTDLVAVPPL
ncbi:MAG: hypothetical protein L3J78_01240 [Thermoplasmata archaeon]|nr:hypothetical protein [Thermoplasmata archaeon]